GNVTRRKTCQPLLPAVVAASSSEGSIERNGVDISKKTMGIHKKLSTKIMPLIEKIFINGCPVYAMTGAFRMPALGPSSMIQPTTLMIPGIANETKAEMYASLRNGASLRSASQAREVP